jgi:hypothetical protein
MAAEYATRAPLTEAEARKGVEAALDAAENGRSVRTRLAGGRLLATFLVANQKADRLDIERDRGLPPPAPAPVTVTVNGQANVDARSVLAGMSVEDLRRLNAGDTGVLAKYGVEVPGLASPPVAEDARREGLAGEAVPGAAGDGGGSSVSRPPAV